MKRGDLVLRIERERLAVRVRGPHQVSFRLVRVAADAVRFDDVAVDREHALDVVQGFVGPASPERRFRGFHAPMNLNLVFGIRECGRCPACRSCGPPRTSEIAKGGQLRSRLLVERLRLFRLERARRRSAGSRSSSRARSSETASGRSAARFRVSFGSARRS